jgi:hypothetical protein
MRWSSSERLSFSVCLSTLQGVLEGLYASCNARKGLGPPDAALTRPGVKRRGQTGHHQRPRGMFLMHRPPCQRRRTMHSRYLGRTVSHKETLRGHSQKAYFSGAAYFLCVQCLGHGVAWQRQHHLAHHALAASRGKGWYDSRRPFVSCSLRWQTSGRLAVHETKQPPSLASLRHRSVTPLCQPNGTAAPPPETCTQHCNAAHHLWEHGLRI